MEEQRTWEVRRKDRQSSEQEARELLSSGEYGVLSTVGPDGEPYGVPLSYVFRDGDICFHSAPEGRKLQNLTPNARASFCVVGATEVLPAQFSTRYQSVIASGEVRELEGEEKTQALGWLVEKYSPEFLQQGREYIASSQHKTRVFALRVRHLSGKRRI
jgi:nitroimidazol reductase NimA-like FMN-containing flavoprotein (pyridoxamine 5'-phosphate oxidase superfamily)